MVCGVSLSSSPGRTTLDGLELCFQQTDTHARKQQTQLLRVDASVARSVEHPKEVPHFLLQGTNAPMNDTGTVPSRMPRLGFQPLFHLYGVHTVFIVCVNEKEQLYLLRVLYKIFSSNTESPKPPREMTAHSFIAPETTQQFPWSYFNPLSPVPCPLS